MAISSKLQVVTKDSNNQLLNRTVSYVNPATSDYDLKNFATAYTGLSSRTVSDVYRIDREDITDATTDTDITPADTGTTVDTGTSVAIPTSETSAVTASISTGNGVLTFTSPWFVTANADIFANKMLCAMVNYLTDPDELLNVTYDYVTGFGEIVKNKINVYGALSDGYIITAENHLDNPNLKISARKSATILITTTPYKKITLYFDDFKEWFDEGELTVSKLISFLNSNFATLYDGNANFAPQFTHNGTAGTITLNPNFIGTSTSFVFRVEGEDILPEIIELIGAGLFESYCDGEEYEYKFTINKV